MQTRRKFIKSAAALGGLMFLPSAATARVKGANERMNIALIGAGGMGAAVFGYVSNA